jgi:hypothetical protein
LQWVRHISNGTAALASALHPVQPRISVPTGPQT